MEPDVEWVSHRFVTLEQSTMNSSNRWNDSNSTPCTIFLGQLHLHPSISHWWNFRFLAQLPTKHISDKAVSPPKMKDWYRSHANENQFLLRSSIQAPGIEIRNNELIALTRACRRTNVSLLSTVVSKVTSILVRIMYSTPARPIFPPKKNSFLAETTFWQTAEWKPISVKGNADQASRRSENGLNDSDAAPRMGLLVDCESQSRNQISSPNWENGRNLPSIHVC